MNFKEIESSQKLSGSYYTPYWLAEFIMRWVLSSGAKSILEPSCGDGIFFDAIPSSCHVSINGFDINSDATAICVEN